MSSKIKPCKPTTICFTCRKTGHFKSDCPVKKDVFNTATKDAPYTGDCNRAPSSMADVEIEDDDYYAPIFSGGSESEIDCDRSVSSRSGETYVFETSWRNLEKPQSMDTGTRPKSKTQRATTVQVLPPPERIGSL